MDRSTSVHYYLCPRVRRVRVGRQASAIGMEIERLRLAGDCLNFKNSFWYLRVCQKELLAFLRASFDGLAFPRASAAVLQCVRDILYSTSDTAE